VRAKTISLDQEGARQASTDAGGQPPDQQRDVPTPAGSVPFTGQQRHDLGGAPGGRRRHRLSGRHGTGVATLHRGPSGGRWRDLHRRDSPGRSWQDAGLLL